MEELQKNHQIVYYAKQNAMGLSMNLFIFGYKQFATTTRLKNLDHLKKLCSGLDPHSEEGYGYITGFAMEQLIDSIKISICFENFMKAMLLLNDFVIHKLDRAVFPDLYKEQFIRPITLNEVRSVSDWQFVSSIDLPDPSLRNQIRGLSKFTIGMKELLSPAYLSTLNMDAEVMRICTPFFQYRNNLHYYISEGFTFTRNDYDDFIKIIEFINVDLVRLQNEIVDHLKKGEQYKLKPITYN